MTASRCASRPRMSRREALAAISRTALASTLYGALAQAGVGTAKAAAPPTLRMAYSADIFTTNPAHSGDTTTWVVLSQMFDPLVRLGRDGKWEGAAAERWEVLGPTTIRFHLRPGVKFHNGDALTSEDVKFTFDYIFDPAVKSVLAPSLADFQGLTIDGPLTVTITTKHPSAALFSNLAPAATLPAKYFQQVGASGFLKAPIGTGPYRFKEWVKDDHVTMEAFPGYARGAPSIPGYSYRAIPEDAARLAALENGEVDLIRPVPVDQAVSLKRSDLRVASRPGQQVYCGLNTLTFAPFSDRRVRQAMNYGVNVESIVRNLLRGLATRLNGPFFPATPGYDTSIPAYAYDPQRARDLLAQAGYAKGFDVTLTVPTGYQGTQKLPEVGQAMAGDLARIGVRAKVVLVEPAKGFDLYAARKFEMYLFAWGSNPEAGRHIETLFASYTRGYYYKNAEVDSLIRPFMATLDVQGRATIGRRLLHVLHDDAPWIFLYTEPDLYGVRKSVQWTPNPYDYVVHVNEMKLG